MTNIIHAIVLGIVQGLTELLPISSSAHLYAIPKLLGWGEIGDFDVALHAGTLLAIAIFFWKDWIKLIVGGYKKVVKKEDSFEGKMFWYLVAATIPGGIIGFILDHFLEGISKKEIEICHMEEYLWNVFEYGVITDYIKREKAKETKAKTTEPKNENKASTSFKNK